MAFPVSADSWSTILSSTKQNDSGFEADLLLNRAFDALEAIEAKLGVGSTLPAAGTVLRGGAGPVSAWSAIETGDITNNAITVSRPAVGVGSTDPTTTNTTVAAIANPTVSVVIPAGVTADVYAWVTGTVISSTSNAIVSYYLRIDGGGWQEVTQATVWTTGRVALSGFHRFASVTAGTKVVEIGNSSNDGGTTITHYGAPRRLMAVAVAK